MISIGGYKIINYLVNDYAKFFEDQVKTHLIDTISIMEYTAQMEQIDVEQKEFELKLQEELKLKNLKKLFDRYICIKVKLHKNSKIVTESLKKETEYFSEINKDKQIARIRLDVLKYNKCAFDLLDNAFKNEHLSCSLKWYELWRYKAFSEETIDREIYKGLPIASNEFISKFNRIMDLPSYIFSLNSAFGKFLDSMNLLLDEEIKSIRE